MLLAKKLNQGAGTPIVPADAQFNYVTMLLHGDGTNGAQNNTFIDSSTNNFSITRNGNTTQGSFSPYGSGWSNYFSDGAYLSVPNNSVFNHGSGDFTVEAMFVRTVNTGGSQTIIAKYESGWQASYSIVIVGDTWDVYMTYGIGSYTLIYSGAAPAVGVWSHMALQRSGSYWEFYCNGVRLAQVTAYTIASTTSAIRIGELGAGYSGYSFNGHISNVRIRNGYATYSGSTYTVPTANLTAITGTVLLTCQSNRFIDNSSNNFTVTSGTVSTGRPSVQRFNPFGTSTAYSTSVIGGSGYFDGSGDYLVSPASSSYQFAGDFTIEYWANLSVIDGVMPIGQTYTGNNFQIYYSADGSIEFGGSNLGLVSTSAGVIVKNSWHHGALVRSGSTITLYINGVSKGTITSSSTVGNNATIGIGARPNNAYNCTGYISNVRLVSSAVYTTTFTPPTTPFTAISGTVLLLSTINGAIFDNAMMNDLETVGNAQISTSVKKYGTGSMSFDGSGDWLIMPYGPTQNFGTGAFTIEGWFYLNSLAASYYVPAGTWGSGTSDEWLIQIENNGSIRFLTTSGSTFYSASITTATWYHIAVVRSGSTVTIYVNGTSVGSYTCSNSLGSVSKTLYIGSQAGTWDWNGYIDDFRITNGYARYTANFTAPTSAFSDTGPI